MKVCDYCEKECQDEKKSCCGEVHFHDGSFAFEYWADKYIQTKLTTEEKIIANAA